MSNTSATLLDRLKQKASPEDWQRFVQLYTPLIYYWARGVGLSQDDAADLGQEVLLLVYQKLPSFEYDGSRSFRAWLKTVTLNKWRDRHKAKSLNQVDVDQSQMDQLAQTMASDSFEEKEYRRQLVYRALQIMQSDFQPSTWQACWLQVVEGKAANEVADQLEMTLGAVYAAKFRVLARLRQELRGFLEE